MKSNALVLRKLNFKKNPIALLVRLLSSIKMYIVVCNKMCFYLKNNLICILLHTFLCYNCIALHNSGISYVRSTFFKKQ